MSDTKVVFAVTRNGRRLEDINYISRASAESRVKELIAKQAQIKKTFPQYFAKYEIVETSKPNKVW
tara:strand:+ start:855 stop:1052 length:198 start_codon:yes stop_codon:yes gene_type:complete